MSRAFTNALAKEASLEDGEIFEGDLVKEGKATWTCDSTSQWLWRGEDKEFQYLIDRWKEEGVYDDIKGGTVHVIWTGGEPTIKGHQESIVNFTKYLDNSDWGYIDGQPFYEIETNGTIVIENDLFEYLDQINCSPKLANSGMTEKQRIVPAAIKRIMEHENYQFKFVVSNEEDMEEIMRDFVKPFNIPLKNIVIMPGLDDSANFEERTRFSLEMAKRYKVRGLTRLHIAAWNKTLNV
jgi:organic radical activating enzyme